MWMPHQASTMLLSPTDRYEPSNNACAQSHPLQHLIMPLDTYNTDTQTNKMTNARWHT